MSNPSASESSETLISPNNFITLTIINVITPANTIVIIILIICATNNLVSSKNNPFHCAAEFIDFCVNSPVAIPPHMPPIPWHPNASRASSYPNLDLTLPIKKKHIGDTSAPIIIDDQSGTNPAPGVIATRPTTAPVAAPRTVGFHVSLFLLTSM